MTERTIRATVNVSKSVVIDSARAVGRVSTVSWVEGETQHTRGTKEVTDGTGAGLEKIPLDNPVDVVGSLARRLGKDVLQVEANNPLVVNFKQTPGADVSAMEATANVRRGDVPIDNNSWSGSLAGWNAAAR